MVAQTSYVVQATGGKYEVLPAAAKAILGEYIEDGEHKGRKVYRRQRVPGQKDIGQVLLWFQDASSGKELSGWWFGDQIGGGQVWARATTGKDGSAPPDKGWKCPVDGPVQRNVQCVPKGSEVSDKQEPAAAEDEDAQTSKKRAVTTDKAPLAKRPRFVASAAFVMTSNLGEGASDEVKKLVGEYVEQQAKNHGKGTYLKANSSAEPIWLYYWDSGDEFSGWWFGSKVGGSLVYARASQHNAKPPVRGWKIPHNQAARKDVELKLKEFDEDAEMTETQRLQQANDLLNAVEAQADKAIQTSKTLMSKDDLLEEGVRAAFGLLSSRLNALEEAQCALTRHSKAAKRQKVSDTVDAELSLLEEKLSVAMNQTTQELDRVGERVKSAEQSGKEDRDRQALEAALPAALEIVSAAETATVVATTPQSMAIGRAALKKAQAKVSSSLKAAKRYAPEARNLAINELLSLQQRCDQVAEKLGVRRSSGEPAATHTEEQADENEDEDAEADEFDDDDNEEVDAGLGSASSPDERLKLLSGKVGEAENSAQKALEAFNAGKGSDSLLATLQQLKLLRKAAAQELKGSASASTTASAFRALRPRLEAGIDRLAEKYRLAKQTQAKVQPRKVLPGSVGNVDVATRAIIQAEDLVEKAVMFYDDCANDAEKKAVDIAQHAADQAQEFIASARVQVDLLVKAAKLGKSAEEQKIAFAEIAPLRNRLVMAQKRLNPYKNPRRDYQKKATVSKAVVDMKKKVSSIEADVARLESKLSKPITSEVEVASVEKSIAVTLTATKEVKQLLFGKEDGSADIKERCEAARERLDELRSEVREQRLMLGARVLVNAGNSEAAIVEDLTKRLKAVEAPIGDMNLSAEKAKAAIGAAETFAVQAEPVTNGARLALLGKLREAKAIKEETIRIKTSAELERMIAQVGSISLKVAQLKVNSAAFKTKMQFPEAVKAVVAAEEKAALSVAAAKGLSEDNLEKISKDDLAAACAKAQQPEKAARAACAAARSALDERHKDPRNWSSPSFHTQLTKLSNRLEAATEQLDNIKAAATDAETNRKTTLKDQKAALAKLAKTLEQVEVLALPLGDEKTSEASEDKTAEAVTNAQEALHSWSRQAENFKKNPHIAMRLAMLRLIDEAKRLQQRFDDVKESTRDQRERAQKRAKERASK